MTVRKKEVREKRKRGSGKLFLTFPRGLAVCCVISSHYFLSEKRKATSLQVNRVNWAPFLSPAENLLSPHQNTQMPSGLEGQKQPVKTESIESLLSLFIPTSLWLTPSDMSLSLTKSTIFMQRNTSPFFRKENAHIKI